MTKTHKEIADYFSEIKQLTIDRSTITKILSDKEKWINISSSTHYNIFHHKSVKFPDLEKAMSFWISQVSAQGLVIIDKVVAEKVKVLGERLGIDENDLVFSNGWLCRFKQRNNLKAVRIHGEANSAPLENLPLLRNKLQEITSRYDLENIFNADETGLFYCMSPNQTLSTGPNKEILTVLLTTNATGTRKLKPIVIGKSVNPRCFKNVNMSLLPVIYKSTPKAWMHSDIFEDWLRNLDNQFQRERKHILLLIDNAPSHVDPGSILDEQPEEKKKQKCTAISGLLKKEICVYYQENDKKTHKEIADYFKKWINISSSTHYNIFRHKSVKFPDLEKAMSFWISQVSAQGLVITDKVVAEKAKVFGERLGIDENDLVFSNGWLHGFKQRNNLKAVRIHGEANKQATTDGIIESLNQSDLSDDLEILEYVNDNELSLTEKPLDDDEIVQMVLDEANNVNDESEGEDIDELKVIATNEDALKAVDTLIEYFEHQNDLEFNENYYKNLKKY
ncbi:8793_t:CDS:2 [Entrophospora sp. SA101]|nr:8793_t:CDS:2 [Entrophospora sp. SA101]